MVLKINCSFLCAHLIELCSQFNVKKFPLFLTKTKQNFIVCIFNKANQTRRLKRPRGPLPWPPPDGVECDGSEGCSMIPSESVVSTLQQQQQQQHHPHNLLAGTQGRALIKQKKN